jgi:RNA polymerase sigma-70 factor (ECF subfamily)
MQSQAQSQHEDVLSERRRQVVRELLDQLPEEQAETFALRVAMGFSLPEVAAATGAPLNTVRSRIRLAKEALRRRIDADPRLLELLEGDA